jgi:hypothetical protein
MKNSISKLQLETIILEINPEAFERFNIKIVEILDPDNEENENENEVQLILSDDFVFIIRDNHLELFTFHDLELYSYRAKPIYFRGRIDSIDGENNSLDVSYNGKKSLENMKYDITNICDFLF